MSEFTKTFVFAGAAIGVLLLAFLSKPQPSFNNDEIAANVGTLNEVEDPLLAKRLEITTFDEDTSELKSFEIAEINGIWSIPSHQNYPADADPTKQLGPAAASIINLNVLGLVSTSVGDQPIYGVVEPNANKLTAGVTGVGMHVVMKDAKGENLVNMVIGKQVQGSPGQRYVRLTNQDAIYVAELDPSRLSTKFATWIEPDLLKLNANDVRKVWLKDYSVDTQLNNQLQLVVAMDPRSEIEASILDDAWSINSLKTFNRATEKYETVHLASDDKPNTEMLDALRSALDNLQIVGVERKPEGLSRNLQADESFLSNNEAMQSLFSRGFFPFQNPAVAGAYEIFSSEGEVICQMNDGVEYVLRFGDIAGSGDASEESETSGTGLNRYLFVMARFNEDAIAKPELIELPDTEGADPSPDHQSDPQPSDSPSSDSPSSEPGSPDSDAAAPTEEEGANEIRRLSVQPVALVQEESPEPEALSEDQPATDQAGAEPAAESPLDPQAAQEALGAAIQSLGPTAEGAEQGDLTDQDRETIEQENQRMLDLYTETVANGQARVQELNERFGDWYYVISDEVYQKIHLSREDVVKNEASTMSPLDQLRDLENVPGLSGSGL